MYHINCERHYSFSCICGPEKGRYVWHVDLDDLLRSGVLRDRFGTLAHSMLGQFSGQEKTDSCLYFTAADCRFLVVTASGEMLRRRFVRRCRWQSCSWIDIARLETASVGMNLFEHLVDVDAVALFPLSVPLLAATWPWCFGRLLGYPFLATWPVGAISTLLERSGKNMICNISEKFRMHRRRECARFYNQATGVG